MSKPTPGPWTIEDDASECVVSRDPEANEFYIVARTHGPDDVANARLIAAAPDLLAALREIDTIVNESASECRKRMGTRLGNILVTARAAIAKAEGVS